MLFTTAPAPVRAPWAAFVAVAVAVTVAVAVAVAVNVPAKRQPASGI